MARDRRLPAMQADREFGGLRVKIGGTPPVYDPGGPTWVVAGVGDSAAYEALETAARAEGAAQIVAPRGDGELLLPLGFEAVSHFWRGTLQGAGQAEDATERDLDHLLDLAASRRAAYAKVRPVFWREAQSAREKQASWFRHLLNQGEARVLRTAEAFLVAVRRGSFWAVDDFCVARPEDWDVAGRSLLTALRGDVEVVCACHDAPKQALIEDLALERAYAWYQKPLGD